MQQLGRNEPKFAIDSLYSQDSKRSVHFLRQNDVGENFNDWSFRRRFSIFNKSTPIFWNGRRHFPLFLNSFGDALDRVNSSNRLEVWGDTTRDLVFAERMCEAVQNFKDAGSVKRHVLLTHFDENWGAFSGYIEGRTVNSGPLEQTLGKCSFQEVMEYINHNNTLAVITTQFQLIDHPKVHSIPLGLKWKRYSQFLAHVNRSQLLMVNAHESPTRKPQIETVVRNFHGAVNNTYGLSVKDYFGELSRSKFVLAPSGLGWDCYRNWEALYYGAIPVIEHYNRSDGWFRSYDGLPVVWVSDFSQVTPEFLELKYMQLAQSQNYTYEKLTSEYWINFVLSFRDSTHNSESIVL